MSLDSFTLYHRQRQYRAALGLGDPLRIEFAAGGVCAPLSPIFELRSITIAKIAEAYDLPPELLLPIPGGLPSGP